MEKYLLGIDIGTSACKVAAFDLNGTVMASASAGYSIHYPRENWAEQNPDDWWQGVCRALKEIFTVSRVQAEQIAGIGVDGQGWGAVALDQGGNVLTNTPLWMDVRSRSICDRLNESIDQEEIFRVAGNSLQPTYSTAKVIWYRENQSEIYGAIDTILQSNSFIVYRLTGQKTIDKSQGYGIHCFDMRSGKWNEEMAERLGIPIEFLPPISESCQVVGAVTEAAAGQTGLIAGTPVVAGGLDAACGALGAGVVNAGETQEQGGQAGGMSICLDEYKADPRLILSYHVVPGKWLLQGGTTGGGGTMRWLEREFADYERKMAEELGMNSFEQLNILAEQAAPGSDGLIFLPYMAGERSPIWDTKAKGVYYGLDFAKTKGHFVRATMEGVAYSLKHNLDVAAACGAQVDELRAMGGAANSLLWTQIKADITRKTIKVAASDTATTLGAAILAGVGTELYRDCAEGVARTVKVTRIHHPDLSKRGIYDQGYEVYLEVYQQLADLMKKS